jgi:hypothetical protein
MQNLFKNLKNEKLSDSEKQIMFNRLNSFIEENPIQTVWYKNIGNKIVSPFQDGFLLHHKMLASAFVIVILVSATGGTSIVANSSVPGNLLYPVKINLNEKVETFTAISSEAKAVVEAKHINERLSEAEILSTQSYSLRRLANQHMHPISSKKASCLLELALALVQVQE